jgi:hypothetical protein
MPTPRQLSRELRLGRSPDLKRRRQIIGLSLAGVGIGAVVGLYQTGVIDTLPDPPVGPFDSERVNASDYAYKRAQVPDAFGMVLTYGATAALAASGGMGRATQSPLIPLAMAGKILGDVATNLTLAREEWADNKALCAYCQTATLLSVAALALAAPEAIRAARRLFGRG